MKHFLRSLAIIGLCLFASSPSSAHGSVSVGIGVPGFGFYYSNPGFYGGPIYSPSGHEYWGMGPVLRPPPIYYGVPYYGRPYRYRGYYGRPYRHR